MLLRQRPTPVNILSRIPKMLWSMQAHLVLLARRRTRPKQVPVLLIVDLQHAGLHTGALQLEGRILASSRILESLTMKDQERSLGS